MRKKLISPRSVSDYSLLQVATRLIFLAGILMASSYLILFTINAIIKALS